MTRIDYEAVIQAHLNRNKCTNGNIFKHDL